MVKPLRDRHGVISSAGACPTCGKVRFTSRKDARAAGRRLKHTGDPLSAYRCGDYWHIGHLPTDIRRGVRSRDQMTPAIPRGQAARSSL